MKISEAINKLKSIKKEHGNLEVVCCDANYETEYASCGLIGIAANKDLNVWDLPNDAQVVIISDI